MSLPQIQQSLSGCWAVLLVLQQQFERAWMIMDSQKMPMCLGFLGIHEPTKRQTH